MKISSIIVDDEPRAHLILKHYCERLDRLEVKTSAYNVMEAYNYLQSNPVDLVFLDINMPELEGFSLLEMIPLKPMVILTTAYTDHAFRSYEYGVIDYLHKPIRFERFVQAVEKVSSRKGADHRLPATKIELRVNGINTSFSSKDILYIEGLGNYCRFVFTDRKILVLGTLKDFEQKLYGSCLVRIHKSYILNLSFAGEIRNFSVMVKDEYLPVGRNFRKYVAEKLSFYQSGEMY